MRSTESNNFSQPRPLFVDRTLLKLAKDDPAAYSLSLEGMALLAWDISWVCWTQGLSTASETWEDIYDVGRNLWLLLAAPPPLVKSLSTREQQHRIPPGKEPAKSPTISPSSRPAASTEYYSHGTAHSFLGSAEGMEFMNSWKMPSPIRIADKLKSTLSGEMANAEWELLEESEWDQKDAHA